MTANWQNRLHLCPSAHSTGIGWCWHIRKHTKLVQAFGRLQAGILCHSLSFRWLLGGETLRNAGGKGLQPHALQHEPFHLLQLWVAPFVPRVVES